MKIKSESMKTNGNASLPVIIYNEDIEALEHELSLRIVHMIYRKKDGSLRDAYGTRCHALIPPEYHPKGLKTPPAFLLNYWDTQRGGWRCLIRDRLIGFEEVSPGSIDYVEGETFA